MYHTVLRRAARPDAGCRSRRGVDRDMVCVTAMMGAGLRRLTVYIPRSRKRGWRTTHHHHHHIHHHHHRHRLVNRARPGYLSLLSCAHTYAYSCRRKSTRSFFSRERPARQLSTIHLELRRSSSSLSLRPAARNAALPCCAALRPVARCLDTYTAMAAARPAHVTSVHSSVGPNRKCGECGEYCGAVVTLEAEMVWCGPKLPSSACVGVGERASSCVCPSTFHHACQPVLSSVGSSHLSSASSALVRFSGRSACHSRRAVSVSVSVSLSDRSAGLLHTAERHAVSVNQDRPLLSLPPRHDHLVCNPH